MATNVSVSVVAKIYSAVERMHNRVSSVKMIVLVLREHITTFLEIMTPT